MPTNQYGVAEFDQDPETAAQIISLKNRQKLAEAMMAQGNSPLKGQMVGRVYVPPSMFQGFGNLANAYVGGQEQKGVEEGYKGLAGRKAQETADAIAAYKRGTMGTPEQPMGPPTEEGAMGVKPAVTPSPDQRRQAIIEAAVSSNPRLSKMGQMDFQLDAQKEAKQDVIKARMDELTYRLAEGRITKEEADKRAADLRREMQEAGFAQQKLMAQLAAGLRQPKDEGAPVAVTGPDGKPIYVSKKDAIGKTPAAMDIKADIQKQKELDKAAGVDKQLDAIERNIDKIMTPEGTAKPALKSYTGQLDQYYPEWAMSNDTAAAGSALKSLQEQMTMMNLAGAKAAVGQSFGSMQVKEWDKFMNLLTNVSRGAPDAEIESNVKFIRDFVKDKRDVLRAAIYGGTHGVGGATPNAAPMAQTPDDAGYEDWKKSKGLK